MPGESLTCDLCRSTVDIDELRGCNDCSYQACESCHRNCTRYRCGVPVCDNCYRYCDHCGDSYCENCGGWCSNCDEWRCDSCIADCCPEERDNDGWNDRSGAVHNYSYRPNFVKKGNPIEAMMGVELEVGGGQYDIINVVQGIDSVEDHLYMKNDCSISGVEIVTHPMTLAYAQAYPFEKLLAGLRDAGCYVDDGYGLHIHVGRDAFRQRARKPNPRRVRRFVDEKQASAVHQMMWLLFMARNSEPLEKLARRVNRSYGAFQKPRPGELKLKAGGRMTGERMVAVNCQNAETFELRFMQATLVEQEFYAALEFADASVRYSNEITANRVLNGQGLTWAKFSEWVAGHDQYANLTAEIAKIK